MTSLSERSPMGESYTLYVAGQPVTVRPRYESHVEMVDAPAENTTSSGSARRYAKLGWKCVSFALQAGLAAGAASAAVHTGLDALPFHSDSHGLQKPDNVGSIAHDLKVIPENSIYVGEVMWKVMGKLG